MLVCRVLGARRAGRTPCRCAGASATCGAGRRRSRCSGCGSRRRRGRR